jgi:hypothetical protein
MRGLRSGLSTLGRFGGGGTGQAWSQLARFGVPKPAIPIGLQALAVAVGTMIPSLKIGDEALTPLPAPGTPGWGNRSDFQLARQQVANQKAREQAARDQRDTDYMLQYYRSAQQNGIDAQIGPDNTLIRPARQPGPPTGVRRIFATIEEWEKQFIQAFPGEIPPIRVGRVLQGGEYDTPRPFGGGELRKFEGWPGTQTAGPPAAVYQTPGELTVPSPRPSTGPGRLPAPKPQWGKIGLGLGVIGFSLGVLPRLFSGGSGGSNSIQSPPIALGPTIAPPAMQDQPNFGIGALTAPGFGGVGASQYCGTRARVPRRKCLQRAPVAWRGGQRKGQAAGTKCVKYAARAT